MSEDLSQLEDECRRATDEFVALDWGHLKTRVQAAVDEMISNPNLYTKSMAFLLGASARLPVQAEPARRLNDLISAIATLRMRRKQVGLHFVEEAAESRRGMVA